jgi:PhnB protein
MSNVKPIPEGFHSITPYIVVENAGKLADFLVAAFGAKEHHRTTAPDGSVMHADLIIGDSHVMLGGAPGQNAVPCMLYLYVTDTDATYSRAVAAGAVSVMAPVNQFYGDRNAMVKDPGGNSWCIATHVEDVSPADLERLGQEAYKKRAAQKPA